MNTKRGAIELQTTPHNPYTRACGDFVCRGPVRSLTTQHLMHRPYVLGLIIALSFVSFVPRTHAASAQSVILSEIAWAGSAASTADEWIELANVGTESIPLGGWQLTGVGTSDFILTIPDGTLLNAGATYLISNYAQGDPKSTLNISTDLVTTAVSIPNTALDITLTDTSGTIVDNLVDPGTPNAGSSTAFSSMERNLTDLAWVSAETSTNLLNDQLGSPGVVGHTIEAPSETVDIETLTAVPEALLTPEPEIDIPITVTEEPMEEIADLSIDSDVIATPEEVVVTDPPVESVIETTQIEPSIAPEIIEPDETQTINTVIAETPPVIEDIPADIAPVIDMTSTEEPTAIDIAPSTVETPTVESITTIQPGDLVITALYPSPNSGEDEWVALTNTTNADINLTDVTLTDGSGAVTTLGGTIQSQATLYVLNPKGNLNNEGDTLTLLNSDGDVIGSVTYGTEEFPAPTKGTALLFSLAPVEPESIGATTQSYEASSISETTVTSAASATVTTSPDLTTDSPNTQSTRTTPVATTSTSIPATYSTPNIATRVTGTKTAKTASTRSTSSHKSIAQPKVISIDDVSTLADGLAVTLEGTVVATPGMIGKRTFFLNGLEIYQSQGDLADVSLGDHVRVTGTISVLTDRRRVNIKEGGVTVLGTSAPIVHDYTESLQYGSLVRVTGTVSARDGNAIVLRIDDARSVTITPASDVSIDWTDLAGKTITVTGVLKNSNVPATIVLRAPEDILISQDHLEVAVASTSSSAVPLIGAGAATLIVAGFGAWIWRHRPKSSLTKLTLHPNTV